MSYADDIGSLAGQSGLRDIQACYLGAWTGAWIARYKHRLVMASGTKAGIWDKRMMRNLHPRHGGYPVVEVRLLCSDIRVLRFGSVTIGKENYEFPLAVYLMPPFLRSGPRLSRFLRPSLAIRHEVATQRDRVLDTTKLLLLAEGRNTTHEPLLYSGYIPWLCAIP